MPESDKTPESVNRPESGIMSESEKTPESVHRSESGITVCLNLRKRLNLCIGLYM